MIIDTNVMHVFLAEPHNEAATPVRRWLDKGYGKIVYSVGGKFSTEITSKNKQILSRYVQAGLAKLIDSSEFSEDMLFLEKSGKMKSDDSHILALARHSGARILCTADQNLWDDFRDSSIINNPRGKIYRDQRHSNLLNRNACRRLSK